jgi:hypothetical protein
MGLIDVDENGIGIVYSNDKKEVDAKYLTYKGAYVYEPNGSKYVVSAGFSFDNFIQKYRQISAQIHMETSPGGPAGIAFYQMAIAGILLYNFKTCGPDELQRAYNGQRHYDWDGFVGAFTPVASFVYGVAAAILGAPEVECYAGGGGQNIYNKYLKPNDDGSIGNDDVDASGALWNNPNNVINIKAGYIFVEHYVHWWGLSDP